MAPHLHSFFAFVTDIGDSASLLAIVAASSVYLFSRKAGSAAAFLIAALLFSALTAGFLKIGFMGCRTYFHQLDIRSPSGHAACSAAVFWALAMLMRSQLPENRRLLPLLLMTLLIAAIAVSRVWLGAHSTAEVFIGLIAGVIGIALARFFVLRKRAVGIFDAYALALWATLACIVVHGAHLPAEQLLHSLALHLRGHLPFCST